MIAISPLVDMVFLLWLEMRLDGTCIRASTEPMPPTQWRTDVDSNHLGRSHPSSRRKALFVGDAGGQRRGCEPVDDLPPVLAEAIRDGRKHVQCDEYAWEDVSVFHRKPRFASISYIL
jgi:hypothetical protein